MFKKGLYTVVAVAMLAMSAQAGEIKFHNWPTTFTPMPICTVDATMDVGFWIQVKSQTKVIKLIQSSSNIHNYDGCTAYTFANNFPCILSATIARVDLGGGKYIVANTGSSYLSVDLSQTMFDPGIANVVNVCAHIVGADLSAIAGGTKDITVAQVTIYVVPQT
jgi:hypothetical protein